MANFLKNKPTSRSQNMSAAEIWMKVGAFIIVLAVVVYSEYLFIGIIIDILPTGINMIGAITGAVATGASVLALIGAKLVWIRPGSQYIWSWVFMGMEVVILGLNDMLAFALHAGHVTGFLAGWESITAAGPLAAMVGWIFIIFLDLAQVERQKDLELESKRLDAERKYTEAAHTAEMGLRHDHLNQVTARLQDVMNSDAIQMQIAEHAQRMVAKVLTDVSGISAGITNAVQPPTQQPPKQISMAQEASTDVPQQEKGPIQRFIDLFNPDKDEDDGTAGVTAKK